MKVFAPFFLVLLIPFNQGAQNQIRLIHGTTVFVICSSDTIWVACDTKIGGMSNHIEHKVHERNGVIFGTVGIAYALNKVTIYQKGEGG